MQTVNLVSKLFLVLALLSAGCDGSTKDKSPLTAKAAGRNLLLVTLDTTRADRIGCYGYAAASTPTIDSLAKRGVLFESAYCQAPLTLVSHASMMTGLYPKEHGVRDNAGAVLEATHITLASMFKAKGYRTAAFVATYVLDSRFGLNNGFDTYDDDMGKVDIQAQLVERQRPANIVTDRALTWLETNKSGPFFCWVHYYDPHEPYHPPEPFRSAHTIPYDGEIAFMDSQLKRIIDWLEAQKLTDKTTIAVVGDHGEAFGEHGEKGHAMFLYEMNLHTPMIIVDPAIPGGKRVESLVEITDVFPTLVDLFGFQKQQGVSARCLSNALAGAKFPDQEVYSESHSLFNSHGYAEQRSLTTRDWKYISSTKPELYDRKADPAESQNLATTRADVAKRMLSRLLDRYESWTAGKPKAVSQTEESRKALESLGYVGGGSKTSTEFLTKNLPDPKDMLPIIQVLQRANSLLHAGQREEALPLLEESARKSPNSISVLYTLGTTYLELGKFEDAIRTLEAGLKLDTKYSPLWVSMGDALMKAGRTEDALKHYQGSLGVDDSNPMAYYKLAEAFGKLNNREEAVKHLRMSIELRPDFPEARHDLAFHLVELGAFEEAARHYGEAARLKPDDAKLRYNFGIALLRGNKLSEAVEQFREAIKLKPDYGEAHVNMGIALGMQGQIEEAKVALAKAIAIPESAIEARLNLGITLEKAGDTAAAAGEYEKVLEAVPGHPLAAQDLLRLYLRQRAIGDAIRMLKKCHEAAPDNYMYINLLGELLSTAQDEKLRDGKAALEMIRKACAATQYRAPPLLVTLAAAYAETGDFEQAVKYAQQGLVMAQDANQRSFVEMVKPQLEEYLKGRPYRNPKY